MKHARKRPSTLVVVQLLFLALPALGQQKPGGSPNVEEARSVPLSAKYCRPATSEQKRWVATNWAPFESHEIACPLRSQARVVLYVLSVDDYEIEKGLPADAPAPTLPKAVIVTPQGRTVGTLPFAFPFDSPVSLDVAFTRWTGGLPRTVELLLEDPAVGGNKILPSLKWDAKLSRYVETEASHGK
jgi:hypothetical protein